MNKIMKRDPSLDHHRELKLVSGAACTKLNFMSSWSMILLFILDICVAKNPERCRHTPLTFTWNFDELDPFISYSDILNSLITRRNLTVWIKSVNG